MVSIMKKKILISLLIVAFFNLITGCAVSKVVTIEPDQIKHGEDKIEQITLQDGSYREFAPVKGYYTTDGKVTGNLQSGRYVEIPARNIAEIQTGDSVMNITELNEHPETSINRLVLVNNTNLLFDEKGGRFNPGNIISGYTASNERISINLEDVSTIKVKRDNIAGIIGNGLILTTVVIMLVSAFTFNRDWNRTSVGDIWYGSGY
jgi:hypothetical protein